MPCRPPPRPPQVLDAVWGWWCWWHPTGDRWESCPRGIGGRQVCCAGIGGRQVSAPLGLVGDSGPSAVIGWRQVCCAVIGGSCAPSQ